MIGIDLGVRSVHVFDTFNRECYSVEAPKRTTQDNNAQRYEELRHLRTQMSRRWPTLPVFVEAPPLAGSRNIQTLIMLAQVQGVVMSMWAARAVPVGTWKKTVIGNGSASKADVWFWLEENHPDYFQMCEGDQNLIDAACIALYGHQKSS